MAMDCSDKAIASCSACDRHGLNTYDENEWDAFVRSCIPGMITHTAYCGLCDAHLSFKDKQVHTSGLCPICRKEILRFEWREDGNPVIAPDDELVRKETL